MRTLVFLLGSSMLAAPAFAQTETGSPQSTTAQTAAQAANTGAATENTDNQPTDDIVITAQKRVERLVDAPQTVNVVSGEQLEKYNITTLEDVTKLVPGLQVTRNSGREQTISLRGVGFNPDAGTTSTVDVYLNEVPFDATQAIQAQFDIGSIQVLRGPQGTLRGGTGPSGAILIGTRQPNLTKIEANGTASVTNIGTVNAQGGFSFPIISDVLAIRVAGLYNQDNGRLTKSRVNGLSSGDRSYGGRVSILFQPTNSLNFLLTHQEFRDRLQNLFAVDSVPGAPTGRFGQINDDDRLAIAAGPNEFHTKGSATILNGSFDFGQNRLSYVGSRQINSFDTTRDLNIGNALTPAFFGPLGNLPFQQYQEIDINSRQWTHEVRFERTGQHFWLYRFGAFSSDVRTGVGGLIDYTGGSAGACQTAPGPLFFLGLPCQTLANSGGTVRNRGYFTTQTFNFSDDDTLDVGVRYSTSHTVTPAVDQRYNAWTGTASYKHRFSEALLAYVNYGRAYRPGGFDSTGASGSILPTSFYTYGAEKSDSFEGGIKGEILGGRAIYSLSAFYQKFNGFIGRRDNLACTGNPNATTGPNAATVYATSDGAAPTGANACGQGLVNLTYNGDASSRGIEAELRGRLLRGWTAQVNFSWADAHYDNALIPCNDYNGDGVPDNNGLAAVQRGKYVSMCRSDERLSSLPTYQANIASEYSFGLPQNAQGYVRGLARYGSSYTNPFTLIPNPSFFKVDAFIGVKLPKAMEFSIFMRNVFNQQNTTYAPQFYGLFGNATGYRNVNYDQPQEVGAQIRFDF